VIIGDHAFDRVGERDITQPEVYRVLRTGMVLEQPTVNERGDWQAIMVRRMPGGRDAGVVTIVYKEGRTLFVRTVEWMDLDR
jgi:hypothetical protein